MITDDKITLVKNEFVDMMKQGTEEYGHTNPVFALIVEPPDSEKPGMMLFPLPGELMGNTEFKEVLVDKVLPKIAEEIINDKGYKVYTTCFCFEARMWLKLQKKTDEDSKPLILEGSEDDELAKKIMKEDPNFQDIMFIQFEDKYDREVKFFNIMKSTSVDPAGEIISTTTLEELKELSFNTNEKDVVMQGIFVDTFKIFWKPD